MLYFICFGLVSYVPMVTNVSGVSILDCPFVYLHLLRLCNQAEFHWKNKQARNRLLLFYVFAWQCSMWINIIYLINSVIAVSSYLHKHGVLNYYFLLLFPPSNRNSKNWRLLHTEILQKKTENSGRASCHKQSETSRVNMTIRLIKYEETWRVTTILR